MMKVISGFVPLLLLCFFFLALMVKEGESINVLSQRVDVPKPDGSGVVFVQLFADPTDPNIASLTGFNITSLSFVDNFQQLRLWNSVAFDCSGAVLLSNSLVPTDGKLCFLSNISSPSAPEFQNSFTFVALGGPTSGNTGTVVLLNYNRQSCTGIPDLGGSGSFQMPPAPKVSITLSGLQILFSVNATFLRNQTTWFLDFFPFDSSAGGDSPSGVGRTCSNHKASNYPGSFSDWWYSGVRATYTDSVHPSITNALNSAVYPNWDTSGTVWTVTALDCSTVNFQTTIPVSRLIGNTVIDCHQSGNSAAAATTAGNLLYTGTLYVNSLRPISSSNSAGGYFMSTFSFPFSFSVQMTISSIASTSSKWAFAIAVINSQVLYGPPSPSYTLDLETTISSPGLTSPNVLGAGFTLPTYPLDSLRQSLSLPPVLTRVSDNGNCNTGSLSPCKILWRTVVPQLSVAQLNNSLSAFDIQYTGEYEYEWMTEVEGDMLSANVYVDVSAVGPFNNLSTLPVNSTVGFFADLTTMQDNSGSGLSPARFSSGERIWVRHSFQVNGADTKAFVLSLKSVWVCFSDVPGYTPTVEGEGTGCSVDIPGVIEEANGQRYLLYDSSTLSGGIANTPAGTGVQRKNWGWTYINPQDSGWSGGSTVQNGFSINSQPLVIDSTIRTHYFHVVSTVSQASLVGRQQRSSIEYTYHNLVARAGNSSFTGESVKGAEINPSQKAAGSTLQPFLAELWRDAKQLLSLYY